MNIVKIIRNRFLLKTNPVAFWKKSGVKLGDRAEIYSSASFGSEPYLIEIGNHVRINAGVRFITHDGGVWTLRGYDEKYKDVDLFGPIKVGNNVHIGTDAIIMPGVTIGDNCIIGCGAIVTKDIPDNSIAVGIPARVIKTIDEYLEQHINDFDYTKSLRAEEKKNYLLKKYNLQK